MTLPAADVRYIVRTTCLLESRSQLYGDYLHRVLPRRFEARVTQWTAEEAVHGELLRDWLMKNDPDFDFESAFATLMTLPYHADPAHDRSPEEELLSRCVVEAFASGFYRALGDATDEPGLKSICKRLMGDEAKHFAGFMAMSELMPALSTPRKLATIAKRVSELDDDQILFAAHVANHHDAYVRSVSRRRYMGRVYGMYQPDHLQFIQSMLLRTLGHRPSRWAQAGMASALFAALQAKRTMMSA